MNVRLYLLGFKGLRVLQSVVNTFGYEIIKEVVIGKDNNILNDYSTEIQDLCEGKQIRFRTRKTDIEFDKTISIAIGWRWIIDINRVPNLIVLHDSLLPKYRGFNPLVSALINGENKIGVTALFASENYDEGEIIYQEELEVSYPIKIYDAIERISFCYEILTTKLLSDINQGLQLPRIMQNERKVSYSLWRDEDDYRINWNDSNKRIKRFVDAVGYPYDGATTQINNQLYRILEVEEYDDVVVENRKPGKIIFYKDNYPIVVCGQGLIKILKIVNSKNGENFNITSIRTKLI